MFNECVPELYISPYFMSILEYWSQKIFVSAGPWIGWDEWGCWVMASENDFPLCQSRSEGRRQLRNDQSGQCWSHPINSACSAPLARPCLHWASTQKLPWATKSSEKSSYCNSTLCDVRQTFWCAPFSSTFSLGHGSPATRVQFRA